MTSTIKTMTRVAVACLAVFGASQTMAQTITGTVTDKVSSDGWAANYKNITFAGGSTPAFGGSAVIICIDPFAEYPALPSSHTYNVAGSSSVITATAAFANRAEAMIDWVVDNYYTSFVNQTISGYAFNQALWEITMDFNGTTASLDSAAGRIFKDTTQNYGPEYPSMVTALKSAVTSSTWSDSYRSSRFATTFLVDTATDRRYQNMVMITPVPEPSTYLMMFAGVGAMLVWRRRAANR